MAIFLSVKIKIIFRNWKKSFTDISRYAMIKKVQPIAVPVSRIERNEMREMLVLLIGGVVLIAVIVAVVASVAGAVAGVVDEDTED